MVKPTLLMIRLGFAALCACSGCLLFNVAQAQSRIAVPAYTIPGDSTWNGWATQAPGAVGLMIVNLNNGDDTAYYPDVDAAIRAARKKGIFVIAYTYTSYGQRDPAIVRSRIDAIYDNYVVDGIFLDEVPTGCNDANSFNHTQFQYYQELANYVRQEEAGARLVTLNPGTASPNDCWMSIANILANFEGSGLDSYRNTYIDYAWTHLYPPDRFWHIVFGVSSVSDMRTVIELARERGAAWVYVTDDVLDNPYDNLPTYWATEGHTVQNQGVQAPFVTAWPDSINNNGGTEPGRIAFRWRAVSGSHWQVFLDTDQKISTGYHDETLQVGADYLLEASSDGRAKLFHYTGSGANWAWAAVEANASIGFPDSGINLAQFNLAAISPSKALKYQIRALDSRRNTLFTSYAVPFSLNNMGLVFDVLNHEQ